MSNGLIVEKPQNKHSKPSIAPSRKGYIYKAKYLTKDTQFIKNYAHITIMIEPIAPDWKKQEIEIYTSTTNGEIVLSDTANTANSKTIRRDHNLQWYSDDFTGNPETNVLYFLTLDKPLNTAEHKAGKQQVYKFDEISPAEGGVIQDPTNTDGLIDISATAEGLLVSTDAWVEQEDKVEIAFTFQDITTQTKNFSLNISKYTDIYSLEAFGTNAEGIELSEPLKASGTNLIPMLMRISDNEDKLVKYYPWLDYDSTLPFIEAKNYLPKGKLSTTILGEAEIKCILDILILSFAFNDEFSFVEYITGGNDAGKIKGNQYIGYQAKQASTLVNKEPDKICDSRFSRYLMDHPQPDTTEKVRVLKSILNCLSKYIYGKNATGKGHNSFNKALLPWTLRPFGTLTPKKIRVPNPIPGTSDLVDSWVFDMNTTTFRLESEYFTFDETNKTIISPREIVLSRNKVLQIDNKITIPTPRDRHIKQEISSSPGDKNIRSDEDLRFLGYSFVDESKIQQFFGTTKNFNIVINNGVEITTPRPSRAVLPTKDYANIPNGANELFGDLGYTGSFISGTIETISLTKKTAGNIHYERRWRDTSLGFGWYAHPVITIGSQHFEFETHGGDFLWNHRRPFPTSTLTWAPGSTHYGITYDKIKELIIKEFNFIASSITGNITFNFAESVWNYTLKTYRIASGFRYAINAGGSLTTSIFDRQAIFEKATKIKEIEFFYPSATAGDILQQLPIVMDKTINIREIILRHDWNEKMEVSFNGLTQSWLTFGVKDENIAVDRFIYV